MLTNAEILEELILSHENGEATINLIKIFLSLIDKVFKSSVRLSYPDDMKAYVFQKLNNQWSEFNFEKSNNPFAYLYSIIVVSAAQHQNRLLELKEYIDSENDEI